MDKKKKHKVKGKRQHKDFQVASLVLGILSIVMSLFGILSLIMAILAIVFAAKSIKDDSHGMAIAGLVTGIIGFIFSLFWTFIWTLVISSAIIS